MSGEDLSSQRSRILGSGVDLNSEKLPAVVGREKLSRTSMSAGGVIGVGGRGFQWFGCRGRGVKDVTVVGVSWSGSS